MNYNKLCWKQEFPAPPLQDRVASCFVLMCNCLCTSERGAGKRPLGPKKTIEQPDSFNLWIREVSLLHFLDENHITKKQNWVSVKTLKLELYHSNINITLAAAQQQLELSTIRYQIRSDFYGQRWWMREPLGKSILTIRRHCFSAFIP